MIVSMTIIGLQLILLHGYNQLCLIDEFDSMFSCFNMSEIYVDKQALVLHMWTRTYAIFNGYTSIPGPSHHRHPLWSYLTSQTFGGLQSISIPTIWMSCRHVHHLQRFYYVFTHHASLHLQIFDTSYPDTTTHPKNLRRHAYKYPIAFPKLQVHLVMGTGNPWVFSHLPLPLPNANPYPFHG